MISKKELMGVIATEAAEANYVPMKKEIRSAAYENWDYPYIVKKNGIDWGYYKSSKDANKVFDRLQKTLKVKDQLQIVVMTKTYELDREINQD